MPTSSWARPTSSSPWRTSTKRWSLRRRASSSGWPSARPPTNAWCAGPAPIRAWSSWRGRTHAIVFDWKMEPKGPPLGRGGTGTLSVDGKQAGQKTLPRTQPLIWAWDETFDIGLDTGTPVDDADYQVPFAFTGKLGKITIDLGESSVSPEAIKLMMEKLAKKRDR